MPLRNEAAAEPIARGLRALEPQRTTEAPAAPTDSFDDFLRREQSRVVRGMHPFCPKFYRGVVAASAKVAHRSA